ncbi:ferrichrome ABC transporter substrate-binding protein [Enterococcus durans]|uniref:ABC transporter substrate-binding protein n=1 Tax=Enterococcus durans TaxID=53345 RepID=UPI000F4DC00C|nr:ABC transporter substrate-binding protein [Enterococcus durans]NJE63103.1 ferrichrome ABC transporter substrate-binding protein [Enterococcus durans]QED59418.1 ABC transporter substrate-binding protein [Enterococcus durans]QED61820.1 ABC transporter substrate-binding protein [Enterococcus durans]ROX81518.1 ferrichrome ABC transporter substrate-binding protein [Enterococcus durans]HJG22732.1 ABC transporter substrate-binding protein [Enterococcus durans]
MNLKTKLCTITSTLLLIGLLGACSSTDKTKTAETSTTESTNATHTVTDTLGHKVAIPNQPKRIIGSYLEDYLIALGEKPVAQWTVGSGSIQDYLQSELKGVPTISYDLPYEKVLSFEPDLLLISSSATVEGGKYDQYSKIAPTYVVENGTEVTWETQLKDIGKVLDKKEQADKIISDYQKKVKETRTELADKINGKTAAVLWVTNNSAYMVSENRSSGRIVYGDLKFGVPPLVAEVSKEATSDWSAVSSEKLAELDADYIILVNSDKKAAMFNEATWKNLKAVKANNVLELGPESSWLYNGPIASEQMVDDIKERLS